MEEGGVDTGREEGSKRKEDGTVCDGEISERRWTGCGQPEATGCHGIHLAALPVVVRHASAPTSLQRLFLACPASGGVWRYRPHVSKGAESTRGRAFSCVWSAAGTGSFNIGRGFESLHRTLPYVERVRSTLVGGRSLLEWHRRGT